MKKQLHIILLIVLTVLLAAQAVSAKDTMEADTGFRVGTDGFSFENYGSQVCTGGYGGFGGNCYRVSNLTAQEMVRMFGTQVCRSISEDGVCTLSQSALRWMNEINNVVANGHCEGMAVLSSLFYSGIESPADFGASSTNKLKLQNNDALQREIAYWFTTQWFMDNYLIENDPKTQLNYLIKHFNEDPDTVIPIGIYQADRYGRQSAGHAIAAYAVINHGNGIYYIMVYDNNYPNQERYITVDTNRNTWTYQASQNTWTSSQTYSGQGKTNPIQIAPIEPRLGTFKCDFCQSRPSSQQESIWDILSPWVNPSTPSDSSPYTVPTAEPYQPSQPSEEGYSIWDIFSPYIDDSGYSSPTAVPESGGYSIWDIFAPFIDPGSSYSPSDSYSFPTQTPQIVRQPTAVPTAKPLTRPTAVPTAVPEAADTTVETNTISVNSDINIYIETDDDLRAGYDWEKEQNFDEIDGVKISRTIYRTSAVLPNDLKYYLWMNYPESEEYKTFDAVITSPGRFLKLTNIQEAYESPNFIYSPPTYNKALDLVFEAFEVIATPKQLPGVEFVISDEYGEYSFQFETNFKNGNRKTPDAPVDFLIFHNYDEGEIGIWISPLYDEDADLFSKASFEVSAKLSLLDEEGELSVNTPKSKPITLSSNGMFFFNYVDWQNGEPLSIEADLDGDDDYETNRVLK